MKKQKSYRIDELSIKKIELLSDQLAISHAELIEKLVEYGDALYRILSIGDEDDQRYAPVYLLDELKTWIYDRKELALKSYLMSDK